MDFIEGWERVQAVFGYWPNFHDAEVLRLAYEIGPEGYVDVTVTIHVFERERLPDDRGYYGSLNHTCVTFRLLNCADDALLGFGYQNVLGRLEFERRKDGHPAVPILVRLEGLAGLGGTIRCGRVAVVDVRPFTGATG